MVKYKFGVINRVADALSRRKSLLTHMSIEVHGFEVFTDLLKTYVNFSNILARVKAGEKTDLFLHDGFLYKGNQLCVPYCSLRLKIIELHGEGYVG